MRRFLTGTCLTFLAGMQFGIAQADSFDVKRCMNMGNALDAPKEGDWGHVIEERSFKVVKEAGFDTARLKCHHKYPPF